MAAKYNTMENVAEIKKLLVAWAPMSPEASLELLDAMFDDTDVRKYAVSRMELFTDGQLLDFLLQLVQVACGFVTQLFRRLNTSRTWIAP